jgi:regulator of nucleoside diphosphate kinase
MKRIVLTRPDFTRISRSIELARASKSISPAEAEQLLSELGNAQIVAPEDVPADVVTMNSIVRLLFPGNKRTVEFQIVYPEQASLKDNKISIFSPIATALIGYKAGDEVEWVVPGGLTRIRIEEIIYQPEAAGNFDE